MVEKETETERNNSAISENIIQKPGKAGFISLENRGFQGVIPEKGTPIYMVK
jgi:hypothetical protein